MPNQTLSLRAKRHHGTTERGTVAVQAALVATVAAAALFPLAVYGHGAKRALVGQAQAERPQGIDVSATDEDAFAADSLVEETPPVLLGAAHMGGLAGTAGGAASRLGGTASRLIDSAQSVRSTRVASAGERGSLRAPTGYFRVATDTEVAARMEATRALLQREFGDEVSNIRLIPNYRPSEANEVHFVPRGRQWTIEVAVPTGVGLQRADDWIDWSLVRRSFKQVKARMEHPRVRSWDHLERVIFVPSTKLEPSVLRWRANPNVPEPSDPFARRIFLNGELTIAIPASNDHASVQLWGRTERAARAFVDALLTGHAVPQTSTLRGAYADIFSPEMKPIRLFETRID